VREQEQEQWEVAEAVLALHSARAGACVAEHLRLFADDPRQHGYWREVGAKVAALTARATLH